LPYNFLKQIFTTAKYNLSAPEEKILTMMSKTSFKNRIQMTEEFIANDEVDSK
jgi:hypothetical protein